MSDRVPVAEGKRLLTYAQVAELLGVNARTLKRWRAAGKIRPVVLGRQVVRFRLAEVERLIRKGSA